MNVNKQTKYPRVLVVDDEADLRELLQITLISMGFDVDLAANLGEAKRLLPQHKYALCLTDMRLPDGSGIELVEHISRQEEAMPVAVITAFGSAENAVAALKAGAFDYLSKPVALDSLRALIRSAVPVSESGETIVSAPSSAGLPMKSEVASTRDASDYGVQMIGNSPQMESVKAQALKLGRSMAPVAISGESGTGKELAARLVHSLGGRAAQPFVAVNCGAIPEMLMEAEFFGYRKGAFTGAEQDRDGFFAAASGGTLFLDEVADLPLQMQVKLLRAIQEKKVRKVGATSEEPVDVRIISATHQDLEKCVAEGRFRQDLFYRLNVIELKLPALRDRTDDLELLANSILDRLAQRSGMASAPLLASVTLKYLQTYQFPGNVRELENMLERALAFSNGEVIFVEDLGLRPSMHREFENERAEVVVKTLSLPIDDPITDSLPDYLDEIEREMILKALAATEQNRTAAARRLGITFRALRYRMQRLEMN
jgi:two-component system, NtrC family, response regulator PilR